MNEVQTPTLDRLTEEAYNYYRKIGSNNSWDYALFYSEVAMGLSGTHALAALLWNLDLHITNFGFSAYVDSGCYSKSIEWFLLDGVGYIETSAGNDVKRIVKSFVVTANVYLIEKCDSDNHTFSKLRAEYRLVRERFMNDVEAYLQSKVGN